MVSSIIFSAFSSRSSINDVFNFGHLNNLQINGVFFCSMAVIYPTLFFWVYGFLINVHHINTVLPVNILVCVFSLQYRANNFSPHLNCEVFKCS
jgi:hypothetical protein